MKQVEVMRENENLKGRVKILEGEVKALAYEKTKLSETFDEMKKKVEERVPVITEVEKRRVELEYQMHDKSQSLRNI